MIEGIISASTIRKLLIDPDLQHSLINNQGSIHEENFANQFIDFHRMRTFEHSWELNANTLAYWFVSNN